jgi:hypothetical protein
MRYTVSKSELRSDNGVSVQVTSRSPERPVETNWFLTCADVLVRNAAPEKRTDPRASVSSATLRDPTRIPQELDETD